MNSFHQMTKPLRILHLEDDPADAELVAAALAAKGLQCEFVRAASRDEFFAGIEHTYDLILADLDIPGFDGIAAQRLARERHPDVPFVFVSGTMGEEVAIERLREGATDYVLKQRLERLPSAVLSALQDAAARRERLAAEAEIRRLNAELEHRVDERTRELAQANALMDSIIDCMPVALFVKDAADLKYVRFNVAGEALLGIPSAEVIGCTDLQIFPEEMAEAHRAEDRLVLEGRSILDIPEQVIATRCRGPRVVHSKKRSIVDAAGVPRYLLGISEDITDRKAIEEEARLARLEAERANSAKSEFLSRMSHDLRTPLNAVLGFAQLLELEPQNERQKESVGQILSGGRHLLDLINGLLDIATIEARRLSPPLETVDVSELVHEVVDLLAPLGIARQISVQADVDHGCLTHLRADRQRLKQVLLNLVGNAVKYNFEGGRVLVSCTSTSDGRVTITVTDTGQGIPPDKLGLLFQPFERLGAEQTAVEGTGLGLTGSKSLTHAMGGTIGVRSHPGHGAEFWVEFPAAPGTPAADATCAEVREPVADLALSGTVLYIEDNPANLRLMSRVLARRPGVTVLTAATGAIGLALARAQRPDLVFLDLHLPDQRGEEVLRQLRADAATRDMPVAVLSADATPGHVKRLLDAGATAYVTKPLAITEVLCLVDTWLGRADAARSAIMSA